MSLGLSHSLSRYKLKFSPDKVGLTHPSNYIKCEEGSSLLRQYKHPWLACRQYSPGKHLNYCIAHGWGAKQTNVHISARSNQPLSYLCRSSFCAARRSTR